MVKRNVIATKLTKTCTQTQKRAFDVAVAGRPRVLEDRHLSKAAMGQPLLVKVPPQWHGDPLSWRRKEV